MATQFIQTKDCDYEDSNMDNETLDLKGHEMKEGHEAHNEHDTEQDPKIIYQPGDINPSAPDEEDIEETFPDFYPEHQHEIKSNQQSIISQPSLISSNAKRPNTGDKQKLPHIGETEDKNGSMYPISESNQHKDVKEPGAASNQNKTRIQRVRDYKVSFLH